MTTDQIPGKIQNLRIISNNFAVTVSGTLNEEIIDFPVGTSYVYKNGVVTIEQTQIKDNESKEIKVLLHPETIEHLFIEARNSKVTLEELDNPDLTVKVKLEQGEVVINKSSLKKFTVQGQRLSLKEENTAVKKITDITIGTGTVELIKSASKFLKIKGYENVPTSIQNCMALKTEIKVEEGKVEIEDFETPLAYISILKKGTLDVGQHHIDNLEARIREGEINVETSLKDYYGLFHFISNEKVEGSMPSLGGNNKKLVLINQGGPVYLKSNY